MGEYYAMQTRRQYDLAGKDVVCKSFDVRCLHGNYVILVAILLPYFRLVHVMDYYANIVGLLDWLFRLIQFTEQQTRVAKQYIPVLGHLVHLYKLMCNLPPKYYVCVVEWQIQGVVIRLYSTSDYPPALAYVVVQQNGAAKANVQLVSRFLHHLELAFIQLIEKILVVVVSSIRLAIPIPILQSVFLQWNIHLSEVVHLRKELSVLELFQSSEMGQLFLNCPIPRRNLGISGDCQVEQIGYVCVLSRVPILLEHAHCLQWRDCSIIVVDWVCA